MPDCTIVEPPGTYPLTFLVKGVEPTGREWTLASQADKARFWAIAGTIAERVKQAELQRGIDRFGRKLAPVKYRKVKFRRSGRKVDGEPLMPHRALSRTRRLLKYTITSIGILFYWQNGWARILDMHRRGACIKRNGVIVGKLPKRDVFGISPAGIEQIRSEALRHWRRETMPEKKIDPILEGYELAIELPFDSTPDDTPVAPPRRRVITTPEIKPAPQPKPAKVKVKPVEQWDVTDFLASGISVMRNDATTRVKNKSGQSGMRDTGLVITKRAGNFKFAK
jgi:hypothetical protein